MGKGTPKKVSSGSKSKKLKSPSKKSPEVVEQQSEAEKVAAKKQRTVRMINHGLHKRLQKSTSNPGLEWRAESQALMCQYNDKTTGEVVDRTIEFSGRNITMKPRHAHAAILSLLVEKQGSLKGLELGGPIVTSMQYVSDNYNKLHGIGEPKAAAK